MVIKMVDIMENLPCDLVGNHVFGFLRFKDLVHLENASASHISRQIFLNIIPHCPPVDIDWFCDTPSDCVLWFAKKKCRMFRLKLTLTSKTILDENLLVENCNISIKGSLTVKHCRILNNAKIAQKV